MALQYLFFPLVLLTKLVIHLYLVRQRMRLQCSNARKIVKLTFAVQ